MTATDERLGRLEESMELLLQQLEQLLDEQYPPRAERPLLRVVGNEEARGDG
jgi:hypothetical protein